LKQWAVLGCLIICLGAFADTPWTVEKARQEALRYIPEPFDTRIVESADPHYAQNMQAKNAHQQQVADRTLTFFTSGGYGVSEAGSTLAYYYDKAGHLQFLEVGHGESKYPYKSYKFSYPSGQLLSISLYITPLESYVYSPSGSLAGHWIGPYCYDAQGNPQVLQRGK